MKIILWCNFMWGKADYRFALYRTLNRSYDVTHVPLNSDIRKAYYDIDPDLIISIKGIITPELKQEFNDDKCTTVQLFPDDPDLYKRAKELFYPQYDYYFTNSFHAQKWYESEGINVPVCGFATDPELFNVKPSKKYKCDILFAGKSLPYRHSYLNYLKGFDLKVYGTGWREGVVGYTGEKLIDDDYYTALKSCKIGIDFSESGAGFMNVKTKTMELTASGCLVMTNKFKEMEKYFDYHHEIIGFEDGKQLIDKCEYYLNNEAERLRIAKAGHERFMRDHTWESRIEYIFKTIGVKI